MSRTPALTPEQFTSFGELLKFLRRRAGLSQRELSIAVGYSESQISRLEQNQRAPDAAAVAARFVPALDLETERAWAARLMALAAAAKGEPEPLEQQAQPSLHNLPIQLTSFVGREKEIPEIKRLLTPDQPMDVVRLLTLTGPGGTGKTRLALQVAADLLDSFPDGVWLIDLAPLTDPALVPQLLAHVLGVREEAGRPLLDTLTDHLRRRQAMLILDNCEHVIQASAQFADALLHVCSKVTILATSREFLGVAGEQVFYVPSLSAPDAGTSPPLDSLLQYEAVRLFVERAAAVLPDFDLTGGNAPAVAQVCRRLDGIPLAIELAAARLRMLPVEQIAERLDDRFRLLTGGSRTALPRHQTLQASIDWSYGLLTEAERVLLNRLAVFAGGWTLDAAEAVGAGEGVTAEAVFELLAHLVDKSLVVVEDQGGAARYHLLETIRQYALAKLSVSGKADAVRRRHAEYYMILAESGGDAFNSVQVEWVKRAVKEQDNLRAALAWSLSANGSAELGLRLATAAWRGLGYWSEARIWLQSALAHPEAIRHPHAQAWALYRLAGTLVLLGDYAAGQIQFEESLRLFQELGDLRARAWLLNRLGWLAREQGDTARARLRLEESLALSRELGDKAVIASGLNTLGEVAVMQEDAGEAAMLLEASLPLFREQENKDGIAWTLNHLGHVAQLQGEYEQATSLHEKSLAIFRAAGSLRLGTAEVLQSLGETALAEGKPALAAGYLTDALELFRQLGVRAGISWSLAGLAGVAALKEEPERAARLWGAAEALRQSIGARAAPASRATRERLMADVRAQLGEAAFDAAWAAGQAASPEQAIAEALRSAE